MYAQNYKRNYETKSRANQMSENKRWGKNEYSYITNKNNNDESRLSVLSTFHLTTHWTADTISNIIFIYDYEAKAIGTG